MSTNQLHGKTFEQEVIKVCFGFSEEEISRFGNTAEFDIPIGVTTCLHTSGDPVSIKTAAVLAAARHAVVCLSDARRVWAWDRPVTLVVGLYDQVGEVKRFHTVVELRFKMTALERQKLYGELTASEVSEFHETLKTFEFGRHRDASEWAKQRKAELLPRTGAIQLNPKIDSKRQRRLQCSAPLDKLQAACGDSERFTQERGGYRGLTLPYEIASSRRQRRKARSRNQGA